MRHAALIAILLLAGCAGALPTAGPPQTGSEIYGGRVDFAFTRMPEQTRSGIAFTAVGEAMRERLRTLGARDSAGPSVSLNMTLDEARDGVAVSVEAISGPSQRIAERYFEMVAIDALPADRDAAAEETGRRLADHLWVNLFGPLNLAIDLSPTAFARTAMTVAPARSQAIPARRAPMTAAAHLESYRDQNRARIRAAELSKALTAAYPIAIMPFQIKGEDWFRLVTPARDRAHAARLCRALADRTDYCAPVSLSSSLSPSLP